MPFTPQRRASHSSEPQRRSAHQLSKSVIVLLKNGPLASPAMNKTPSTVNGTPTTVSRRRSLLALAATVKDVDETGFKGKVKPLILKENAKR